MSFSLKIHGAAKRVYDFKEGLISSLPSIGPRAAMFLTLVNGVFAANSIGRLARWAEFLGMLPDRYLFLEHLGGLYPWVSSAFETVLPYKFVEFSVATSLGFLSMGITYFILNKLETSPSQKWVYPVIVGVNSILSAVVGLYAVTAGLLTAGYRVHGLVL